ncbi:sulfatase-like hydrolase/transferase [Pseudomonas aeruginosa]|nr:sulfatase-like hydrolase/transferase [Pseudomonas aeruginosa]
MPLIKNRYLNAVREVDTQIGRPLQHLENQHLLENTAVVVLGDHGGRVPWNARAGATIPSSIATRPAPSPC